MAALTFGTLGNSIIVAKPSLACSLSILPRPRRAVLVLLFLTLLYGIVMSWGRTRQIASALCPAGITKDPCSAGVVVLVSENGEDNVFDENQLPFDDVNATSPKSDAEIRSDFEREYEDAGRNAGAGKLYGGTLANLVPDDHTKLKASVGLREWTTAPSFTNQRPFRIDPYPRYNTWSWRRSNRAPYVPCDGPLGRPVPAVSAFAGLPKDFPSPSLGSYSVLGLDDHLCFERDTRLGIYALPEGERDTIDWGNMQECCVHRNHARFDLRGPPNRFMTVYADVDDFNQHNTDEPSKPTMPRRWSTARPTVEMGGWEGMHNDENDKGKKDEKEDKADEASSQSRTADKLQESRTAVLLRSYTGKTYTENDRYMIRALVSELSLGSGGEYQVFLLVHVKEAGVDLWDNATYEAFLDVSVPREFRGMTLLWSDALVQGIYPRLERLHAASVHDAQWLSIQAFMQEFREFAFVWNWEMDVRITGHAYDMLEKLARFGRQQPRRGLWERSERFYIPGYHGAYDTSFRMAVDATSRTTAIWGAPQDLPFVQPIGPQPPTAAPGDEAYRWGVGEDADLITLSPLFDPAGSGWVLGDQVWAYSDANHTSASLPRRGAIVTQGRLSRRLLDIMHVENVRGNHVGSEMAPGTVALLHGLKAVHAPVPVFMDRPWSPARLARWLNNGPRGGSSGGPDSAMGWGREGRFRGCTWYYRADPPQRLYNNWVGYEDHGMGGLEWEMAHGRPCLPAMFLHPVKDVLPTGPGHESESRLPYN